MNGEDADLIAAAVVLKLQEDRTIPEAEHTADHAFVAYLRDRAKQRVVTWNRIHGELLGWVIKGVLTLIALGLVALLVDHLRQMGAV